VSSAKLSLKQWYSSSHTHTAHCQQFLYISQGPRYQASIVP